MLSSTYLFVSSPRLYQWLQTRLTFCQPCVSLLSWLLHLSILCQKLSIAFFTFRSLSGFHSIKDRLRHGNSTCVGQASWGAKISTTCAAWFSAFLTCNYFIGRTRGRRRTHRGLRPECLRAQFAQFAATDAPSNQAIPVMKKWLKCSAKKPFKLINYVKAGLL